MLITPKMRGMIMKRKNKESGQAMVEFAIVVPVLIVILCGILDFGWIYYNKYKVEEASYEAARYAAIAVQDIGTGDQLTGDTEALVRENLPNDGDGADIKVEVNEDEARITVSYPVKNLTFVGWTLIGEYYYATSTSVASV